MKVILTGATGFIGGEVLHQALSHPSITSLVCLTRRALPETATSNPKVKVITLADFTTYTPETLAELKGAEACIWAMGRPAHKNPNLEECRKVEVGYTLAAGKTFAETLAPSLKESGKTFRFVYLSGMFAERDFKKNMWFLKDLRSMKGETESGLLALQQPEGSNFEVSIVRPGGVLAKETVVPNLVAGLAKFIKVDDLAAVMIGEVVGGEAGTRTYENDALRTKAGELLKEKK